jgi:hypothetical protein
VAFLKAKGSHSSHLDQVLSTGQACLKVEEKERPYTRVEEVEAIAELPHLRIVPEAKTPAKQ